MNTINNAWAVSIDGKRNSSLDIFKTPKNLHFLYYTTEEKHYSYENSFMCDNETYKSITLRIGKMPIIEQPSLDDMWKLEDNDNITKTSPDSPNRIFAANILLSSIARKSRRAAGNILIVPNDEQKVWFDAQYKNHNISIVVDHSLKDNELRAAYWKIMPDKNGNPGVVDGGMQISPEGFSCIPKSENCWIDYTSYFARGFLEG